MNSRAYSLIQLLVSLGLGAVVIAGAAYAISQLARSMRFEGEKRAMTQIVDSIEMSFRDDIKNAIRILPTKDSTQVGYKSVGGNSFILLRDNLNATLPIVSWSNSGGLKAVIKLDAGLPEEEAVLDLMIKHATVAADLFVVGGQEEKYLFMGRPSSVTQTDSEAVVVLNTHDDATKILTTNNYPARISYPLQVSWRRDPNTQRLVRASNHLMGKQLKSDNQKLQEFEISLTNLEVFYRFENHDRDTTLILPSAGFSLSSPEDEYWGDPASPWENCADAQSRPASCLQCVGGLPVGSPPGVKCVGWEHLAEATFRVSFKSLKPVKGNLTNPEITGGFGLEDGYLTLTKTFSQKFNAYFRASTTENLSIEDPTCAVPRPFYCDSSGPGGVGRCDHVLNRPNRSSPYWKGYKKGSDWCECGTPIGSDDVNLNWEANMIPHGFGTAQGKAKLEACARVQPCSIHNGSNSYDAARVHPAHWLACSCIQPTLNEAGHVVQRAIYEGANEGINVFPDRPLIPGEYNWREWDEGVDPMVFEAQDRNINCSVYTNSWGSGRCIDAARALSTDADLWGGADLFRDRCRCFNQRVDFRERPLGQMWAHIRDWKAVCGDTGFDFSTPGNTISCPDSMEEISTSKQWDPFYPGTPQTTFYEYKPYDSETNVQGMQPDNLRMCYCLKASNGYGHPHWVLWHGSDVRVGSAIYPDPPNGGVQERHLGHKVWHETLGVIDCAEIARSWFSHHGSPGWCVEDSSHMSEALFTSRMVDLRGGLRDPDDVKMRNYCSNKCRNFTNWQSRREVIRRTITATPTEDPLPSWCGGGGGGGPGGGGGGGGG